MGMRILVVDDEDTVRNVICQVLEDDGHEIVEANCAEKALELFREEPFPLILTDIYMGKMNGIEFDEYMIDPYQDFLRQGSSLVITAKPREPISLSQIKLYKPSDVPALLDLSAKAM